MNIIIGLTGPTGSGKSSACKLCEKYGLKHVDCDLLARKAVERGTDGLKALVASFGSIILNTDGTLNRKTLAKIAFSDQEHTALLNNTIFPFIRTLVEKETQSGDILLDAPTLFESGINEICHKTIAVLCDQNIRLKRIIERDNLTKTEALTRIKAGKDDNFYKLRADYIIYNNKTEAEFLKEFSSVIKTVKGEF